MRRGMWMCCALAGMAGCGGPQAESAQPAAMVVSVPATAEAPMKAGEKPDAGAPGLLALLADGGSNYGAIVETGGDAAGLEGLLGEPPGDGGGGLGTGSTYGSAHGGPSAPSVHSGMTTLTSTAALAPEIIRRVIRGQIKRFRFCYEKQLASRPNLEGKVVVRFVINGAGNVSEAKDAGSTMPDPVVTSCVIHTFKSLRFPKPKGGVVVIVRYPLVFRASSGGDAGP